MGTDYPVMQNHNPENRGLFFVSYSQIYYCRISVNVTMQGQFFTGTYRLQKHHHKFVNKCNTETKVLREKPL
jgi:hypothetical protein